MDTAGRNYLFHNIKQIGKNLPRASASLATAKIRSLLDIPMLSNIL